MKKCIIVMCVLFVLPVLNCNARDVVYNDNLLQHGNVRDCITTCCCKSELRKWIGKEITRTKPCGYDRSYIGDKMNLVEIDCNNLVFEKYDLTIGAEKKKHLERTPWDDGNWMLYSEWKSQQKAQKKCCPCCND